MSTGDTIPGSPELVSIAVVRPLLQSLLLAHTLLTLLVPLLIALLYYSTRRSRRQPIFVLNVLAIAIAFSVGVLADFAGIHGILSPQEILSPLLWVASGVIVVFQSILVDLILFIRLVTVYPLTQVGPRRFALITFLPILLKVLRVVNVIIFLKLEIESGSNAMNTYFTLPNLKIEWAAQVVDNTYASIMFLWTIRGRRTTEYLSDSTIARQTTLTYRLRSLFRIALSNFVIPTLFSVVQLIITFLDVDAILVGDIIYANGMLSVYGVAFASVWAGKDSRRNLEPMQSLENRNRNRGTNSASGPKIWEATPDHRPFAVEVTELVVDSQSEGLDNTSSRVERRFSAVDVESGHEVRLA
ncbi:hypothetical protein HD554DRAFT_1031848 [Boletus coccyginus]|nr:hypothetical protein HD554DRAFT_1031848 [Boletus coccyginus]